MSFAGAIEKTDAPHLSAQSSGKRAKGYVQVIIAMIQQGRRCTAASGSRKRNGQLKKASSTTIISTVPAGGLWSGLRAPLLQAPAVRAHGISVTKANRAPPAGQRRTVPLRAPPYCGRVRATGVPSGCSQSLQEMLQLLSNGTAEGRTKMIASESRAAYSQTDGCSNVLGRRWTGADRRAQEQSTAVTPS
jgi:hypothetical protein